MSGRIGKSRAGWIRLTALVLFVLGGAACTTVGSSLRAPLRVGVSTDYPPVIFEQDGEIVGIEAELARYAADRLGRRLAFVQLPFEELIDALDREDVDVVMSGLSITEGRSRRVRFTEPYMKVGQLAIIRARDVARFGRIRSIRRLDARVGYERGTTGETFVADNLTRATSFAFESADEGIRSLRAGRIDYFVHDAPTVWRLAGDPAHRDLIGLYRPLTEEYLAWAVRRGNRELLEELNEVIDAAKRDGVLEPILARWIPVRVRNR